MAIRLISESKKLKEGKLREITKNERYLYSLEDFSDGSKPLIYSTDEYDLLVCEDREAEYFEVLLVSNEEDDTHEYFKEFKTKKGAVRYAESIINKLDNAKSIHDAALDLDFNVV